MTKRANAIRHDQIGDPLEVQQFAWVEEAQEWCQAQCQEPIEWLDAQIGLEGATKAEWDHLNATGQYPAQYFSVTGYDEATGEERPIEDEDYRDVDYWPGTEADAWNG